VNLEMVPVVDIADLLLLLVLQRSYVSLEITAAEDGHHIIAENSRGKATIAILPLSLGDALVARFCAIAGLDLLQSSGQFGRIRAKGREGEEALAIGFRVTPHGLGAELWRLAESKAGAQGANYDSYEIQKELGRGGLGAVFLAKHKALGRLVAIKVLHHHSAKDTANAERFIREARAAGRVRHPSVVEIIDFGYTNDNRPFLVMELIDGKTLKAELSDPMSPVRALEITRQIASALDAVHSAGVVHRDLKPENIFVSPSNWVKIVDFGAAKDIGDGDLPNITKQGMIFGTPLYMSPEHIQGAKVDHRSDIYALGCMLFEMISGKAPYQLKTPMEIFMAHCHAPIPQLITSDKSIPSIIQEIVNKAMEKDPDKRYPSADAMILDLERAKFAISRKGWRRWLPL
jgi:serine/threonine protein kinase